MSETIKIRGEKPFGLVFTSYIDSTTSTTLLKTMVDAINNQHDELHLLLASPGGQVNEGVALYNWIRALPVPVYTYNMGNVNSIANVVYQAGTKRFSATTSSFMFHDVGFGFSKETRLELKDLREKVSALQNDRSLISEIMTRHTSLTDSEVNELFNEMAYLDAKRAFERGIVDEARDIHFPKNLPIRQLTF